MIGPKIPFQDESLFALKYIGIYSESRASVGHA